MSHPSSCNIGGEFVYYTYDADGELARKTADAAQTGTIYVGGIYEKNLDSDEVTKYYHSADGRRLAMRKGATLSYFANDHLGGTATVMTDTGGYVSRTRYYPYGQSWTQEVAGAPPTDRLPPEAGRVHGPAPLRE